MLNVVPRIPARLAIGLALAIALDSAVQLLWKSAVAKTVIWRTLDDDLALYLKAHPSADSGRHC